ncbi:MAG: hypothetical protein COV46_08505 [Deltaproteobacteria bacterium CG11_big_fil_rev_8_21_14_0_20_49_13]|nr:MAG: hypothetical protein COV46_08505 [Deltaproteobacteria bacterium CG11_big_fil_rev_8_21_14_0_20_49_13]
MAACETFNVVKDSIVSAAQADQILCYVKSMNDSFVGLRDANGDDIDLYDGQPHIFNMSFAADEGEYSEGPSKIKMQIAKDSAGNIVSFKMFMCSNDTGTNVQNEYTDQTINGSAFSMAAIGNFVSAQWSGSHQVVVTGTLDANGAFTEKTISMKNTGGATGDDSNTNWQEATLVQTPSAFTISGYQKGTYSNEGNIGSYEQKAYGEGEMLGDTSAVITNLAMGDGAVNVDLQYTWSNPLGSGTYDPSAEVFAWLGDTLAAVNPTSDSSFYAAAAAGTIPTAASSVSISFTAAQTWDCSDDEAVAVDLPEISGSEMDAACSQYGSMSRGWIDCYSTIQPEGE